MIRAISFRRGFTVVEVAVVITVVLLMAALLVPVFSKAKDRTGLVGTTANLQKIVNAFNLYAADNGGQYPPVGTDVTRMQKAWDGRYLDNEKVFINPINEAKTTSVGSIYLGGGKWVPCFFSANELIYTNWSMTGGAVATPLRVTDAPKVPIVWDQRADRLWAGNYVTLPNGKAGGLFAYPDGSVLLLGQGSSVIRSK